MIHLGGDPNQENYLEHLSGLECCYPYLLSHRGLFQRKLDSAPVRACKMILLIASLNVLDLLRDLSRVFRHGFGSLDGALDCHECGVDGSVGF